MKPIDKITGIHLSIVRYIYGMIDDGNGLTSWSYVLETKLTMFRAHCPFNPFQHLADTKVYLSLLNSNLYRCIRANDICKI